ncbi:MAG: HAMP domain-containing protein, partial [Chloroflexi bacterium]|nr:HAMP domain-containing protein [Chloroflexota bacterium]
MQTIFSLTNSTYPYVDLPYSVVGWLGWFLMVGVLALAIRRFWEPVSIFRNRAHGLIFLVLLVVVPIASLFVGIRLPDEGISPVPGMPVEPSAPLVMFFSALPWILAAGMLGTVPATLLAGITGIFTAFWGTHTIFTPLEMAGFAVLYSAAVRQHYRTLTFRLLRHPLGAAVILSVAYSPIFSVVAFFAINGTLAVRLDYAITQTWQTMLARAAEVIIAGTFAEMLYLMRVKYWKQPGFLAPSPTETSLQTRFSFGAIPLMLFLVIFLTLGDWVVAGQVARKMISDRLESTAQVAARSVPFFLETGQDLIGNMANEDLLGMSNRDLTMEMSRMLREVPYFKQLYMFDADGDPVNGYPISRFDQIHPTQEEMNGINLALHGVPIQTYSIAPLPGEGSAQITFLAAITDESGKVGGVLLGRTDLNSNPFTQPAIQAIEAMKGNDGEGLILDENNRILYHTRPALVMTNYIGVTGDFADFYDDTSAQGTRRLVYYQPVVGRPWAVIVSVPAEQAQQLVLEIAVPLLAILIVLVLAVFLFLQLGLRSIASSVQTLAREVTLISDGQLNHPLPVIGVDEIGRFSRAFEQMRISLKARLDELNRLLLVSQGVAGHLDIEESTRSILQAAKGEDVSSIRIVLIPEVTLNPQDEHIIAFGNGLMADQYAYLDEQIFELMRQEDSLLIPNTMRIRRLNFPAGLPYPRALVALGLRNESNYYGVLWVGYEQSRNFTEEEVRFLTTLA